MKYLSTFVVLMVLLAAVGQAQSTRLKDMVTVEGAVPKQLTGYGLVAGLDRTGDRARGTRGSPYTVNSIVNMLERFGITVSPEQLSARNVAAVMVTATLDPFRAPGSLLDVTVSALGDAKSLSGGILLQTPLLDAMTGEMFVMAAGPVSTSSVLAATFGSSVQVNHTNTGRVPNGGQVMQGIQFDLNASNTLGLVLKRPDFTNAISIAGVINAEFADAATVEHAGLVRVNVPQQLGSNAMFLAAMERLTVNVDIPARIVVNERTGTIVSGGNVRISEVMITYGSLVISTQADPLVSQPAPFSNGETVVANSGAATVEEEGTRSIVLPQDTDVNQLAASLNQLGLTARDVIAIIQAIDRAGALQGDLVIL